MNRRRKPAAATLPLHVPQPSRIPSSVLCDLPEVHGSDVIERAIERVQRMVVAAHRELRAASSIHAQLKFVSQWRQTCLSEIAKLERRIEGESQGSSGGLGARGAAGNGEYAPIGSGGNAPMGEENETNALRCDLLIQQRAMVFVGARYLCILLVLASTAGLQQGISAGLRALETAREWSAHVVQVACEDVLHVLVQRAVDGCAPLPPLDSHQEGEENEDDRLSFSSSPANADDDAGIADAETAGSRPGPAADEPYQGPRMADWLPYSRFPEVIGPVPVVRRAFVSILTESDVGTSPVQWVLDDCVRVCRSEGAIAGLHDRVEDKRGAGTKRETTTGTEETVAVPRRMNGADAHGAGEKGWFSGRRVAAATTVAGCVHAAAFLVLLPGMPAQLEADGTARAAVQSLLGWAVGLLQVPVREVRTRAGTAAVTLSLLPWIAAAPADGADPVRLRMADAKAGPGKQRGQHVLERQAQQWMVSVDDSVRDNVLRYFMESLVPLAGGQLDRTSRDLGVHAFRLPPGFVDGLPRGGRASLVRALLAALPARWLTVECPDGRSDHVSVAAMLLRDTLRGCVAVDVGNRWFAFWSLELWLRAVTRALQLFAQDHGSANTMTSSSSSYTVLVSPTLAQQVADFALDNWSHPAKRLTNAIPSLFRSLIDAIGAQIQAADVANAAGADVEQLRRWPAELATVLLDRPMSDRARFAALEVIIPMMGAEKMLQCTPGIIPALLRTLLPSRGGSQEGVPGVGGMFHRLLVSLRQELEAGEGLPPGFVEGHTRWQRGMEKQKEPTAGKAKRQEDEPQGTSGTSASGGDVRSDRKRRRRAKAFEKRAGIGDAARPELAIVRDFLTHQLLASLSHGGGGEATPQLPWTLNPAERLPSVDSSKMTRLEEVHREIATRLETDHPHDRDIRDWWSHIDILKEAKYARVHCVWRRTWVSAVADALLHPASASRVALRNNVLPLVLQLDGSGIWTLVCVLQGRNETAGLPPVSVAPFHGRGGDGLDDAERAFDACLNVLLMARRSGVISRLFLRFSSKYWSEMASTAASSHTPAALWWHSSRVGDAMGATELMDIPLLHEVLPFDGESLLPSMVHPHPDIRRAAQELVMVDLEVTLFPTADEMALVLSMIRHALKTPMMQSKLRRDTSELMRHFLCRLRDGSRGARRRVWWLRRLGRSVRCAMEGSEGTAVVDVVTGTEDIRRVVSPLVGQEVALVPTDVADEQEEYGVLDDARDSGDQDSEKWTLLAESQPHLLRSVALPGSTRGRRKEGVQRRQQMLDKATVGAAKDRKANRKRVEALAKESDSGPRSVDATSVELTAEMQDQLEEAPIGKQAWRQCLAAHTFLESMVCELVAAAYPGAPFERTGLALELLMLFVRLWGVQVGMSGNVAAREASRRLLGTAVRGCHEPQLPLLDPLAWRGSHLLEIAATETLLASLTNRWSQARETVEQVVRSLPVPLPALEDPVDIGRHISRSLSLTRSPRGRECDAGVRLLRILFHVCVRKKGLLLRLDLFESGRGNEAATDGIIRFGDSERVHHSLGDKPIRGDTGLHDNEWLASLASESAELFFVAQLLWVIRRRNALQRQILCASVGDDCVGEDATDVVMPAEATGDSLSMRANGGVGMPHGVVQALRFIIEDIDLLKAAVSNRGSAWRVLATGCVCAMLRSLQLAMVIVAGMEERDHLLDALDAPGEGGGQGDGDEYDDATTNVGGTQPLDEALTRGRVDCRGHVVLSGWEPSEGAAAKEEVISASSSSESDSASDDEEDRLRETWGSRALQRMETMHDNSPSQQSPEAAGQLLVVSAWVLVKETCLGLAEFVRRAPVDPVNSATIPPTLEKPVWYLWREALAEMSLPEPAELRGLVSRQLVRYVSESLLEALLRVKHMGAVNHASDGLQMVAGSLFALRSSDPGLGALPRMWVEALLLRVVAGHQQFILRRSAGFAAAFTALVRAESAANRSVGALRSELVDASSGQGHAEESLPAAPSAAIKLRPGMAVPSGLLWVSLFDTAVETLLPLAGEGSLTTATPVAPRKRVHALNVLHFLLKDSHTLVDSQPYIGRALATVMDGFKSESWAVRNSSLLLFSALTERLVRRQGPSNINDAAVGVTGAREAATYSTQQTAAWFFRVFPELQSVLRAELAEAVQTGVTSEGDGMHPSLYPVLLLLSRMHPSDHEDSDDFLPPLDGSEEGVENENSGGVGQQGLEEAEETEEDEEGDDEDDDGNAGDADAGEENASTKEDAASNVMQRPAEEAMMSGAVVRTLVWLLLSPGSAGHAHHMARVMSARALAALVPLRQVGPVCHRLVLRLERIAQWGWDPSSWNEDIVPNQEDMSGFSKPRVGLANLVHGTCLQLSTLLMSLATLSRTNRPPGAGDTPAMAMGRRIAESATVKRIVRGVLEPLVMQSSVESAGFLRPLMHCVPLRSAALTVVEALEAVTQGVYGVEESRIGVGSRSESLVRAIVGLNDRQDLDSWERVFPTTGPAVTTPAAVAIGPFVGRAAALATKAIWGRLVGANGEEQTVRTCSDELARLMWHSAEEVRMFASEQLLDCVSGKDGGESHALRVACGLALHSLIGGKLPQSEHPYTGEHWLSILCEIVSRWPAQADALVALDEDDDDRLRECKMMSWFRSVHPATDSMCFTPERVWSDLVDVVRAVPEDTSRVRGLRLVAALVQARVSRGEVPLQWWTTLTTLTTHAARNPREYCLRKEAADAIRMGGTLRVPLSSSAALDRTPLVAIALRAWNTLMDLLQDDDDEVRDYTREAVRDASQGVVGESMDTATFTEAHGWIRERCMSLDAETAELGMTRALAKFMWIRLFRQSRGLCGTVEAVRSMQALDTVAADGDHGAAPTALSELLLSRRVFDKDTVNEHEESVLTARLAADTLRGCPADMVRLGFADALASCAGRRWRRRVEKAGRLLRPASAAELREIAFNPDTYPPLCAVLFSTHLVYSLFGPSSLPGEESWQQIGARVREDGRTKWNLDLWSQLSAIGESCA